MLYFIGPFTPLVTLLANNIILLTGPSNTHTRMGALNIYISEVHTWIWCGVLDTKVAGEPREGEARPESRARR